MQDEKVAPEGTTTAESNSKSNASVTSTTDAAAPAPKKTTHFERFKKTNKTKTTEVAVVSNRGVPWALTICDWCGPGDPSTGLEFEPACRRLCCMCCHYGRLQNVAFGANCLFWCLSLPLGFGWLLIAWRRAKIREQYVSLLLFSTVVGAWYCNCVWGEGR